MNQSNKNTDEIMRAGLMSQASQDMLTLLEDMFYHADIMAKDAHQTAFNCGCREVVAFMREFKPRED